MARFRRSSSGPIIAIDIGSSAIKVLVVLGQYRTPMSVVDFCIIHLTTTGKPSNITELSAILSSVAHRLHAGAATVRATISGRYAVIRIVVMLKSPQDDITRAMAFQLARCVPIPPDEATSDCTPLHGLPARDSSHKILLGALDNRVATQRKHAAAFAPAMGPAVRSLHCP